MQTLQNPSPRIALMVRQHPPREDQLLAEPLVANVRPRRASSLVHLLCVTMFGCAGYGAREAIRPIPEQPPLRGVPDVRGSESAASRIPGEQRLAIVSEIVRRFFRPTRGQARWIDPQPLAHRRGWSADSAAHTDEEWAAGIAEAVGLRRVCALDENDVRCRGRPGGVLRFSVPYASGADSAVVFARYTPVEKGTAASPGSGFGGFELEFNMVRRDGRWHIAGKRTIAGPDSDKQR